MSSHNRRIVCMCVCLPVYHPPLVPCAVRSWSLTQRASGTWPPPSCHLPYGAACKGRWTEGKGSAPTAGNDIASWTNRAGSKASYMNDRFTQEIYLPWTITEIAAASWQHLNTGKIEVYKIMQLRILTAGNTLIFLVQDWGDMSRFNTTIREITGII